MTSTPAETRPVRRSDRVVLRYPRPEDGPEYLRLRRVNTAFLAPWEPLAAAGVDPYAPAAFTALLTRAKTDRRHGLLVTTTRDEAIIGAMNFNEIVGGCFGSCYLGYWLGEAFVGQGYMTDALRLGLDFAFTDLGLHRVEANIMPRNTPSVSLVTRLGFSLEGLSTGYLRIAGQWEDHARWALTQEAWRQGGAAQGQ